MTSRRGSLALDADVPQANLSNAQSYFEVVLADSGDKKIQVIKVVRAVTGLRLKEAKDLVDGAPSVIAEGLTREAAERLATQLEAAGATVKLT